MSPADLLAALRFRYATKHFDPAKKVDPAADDEIGEVSTEPSPPKANAKAQTKPEPATAAEAKAADKLRDAISARLGISGMVVSHP